MEKQQLEKELSLANMKTENEVTSIKQKLQDQSQELERKHSLEIKKLKEEIDNLEDATMMVEESMGDDLKLFLGECFVTVQEEQAADYLSKLGEEKQEELESKTDKLDKLEEEMKGLKSQLYARFGTSINLDEEK